MSLAFNSGHNLHVTEKLENLVCSLIYSKTEALQCIRTLVAYQIIQYMYIAVTNLFSLQLARTNG